MAYTCIFILLVGLILCQIGLLQAGKLQIPKPNISMACEKDGICGVVKNYPTKLIEELIKKLQNESIIFNYDKSPLPKINPRSSFGSDETWSLCDTKPQSVSVQAAKDKHGHWRFIINDLQNPIQVFQAQICRNNLGPCSENIAFGPGYDGACLQKVALREMIFLNDKTNEIGYDYFEVPICCSCTLIRKDNFK